MALLSTYTNPVSSIKPGQLASNTVTTQAIAASAVTAEKMSGNQSGNAPVYGCRAWVNFNGFHINNIPENLGSTNTLSVTAGNNFGFWTNSAAAYTNNLLGVRYKITRINATSGGTLGGVDVATDGIQIIEVISSTRFKFRFLSNQIPTSDASITGNNTSDFTYQGLGIRESGNVNRIIYDGVGAYTIVFQTPMPHANYALLGSTDCSQSNAVVDFGASISTFSTLSCQVFTGSGYRAGTTFGTPQDNSITVSIIC